MANAPAQRSFADVLDAPPSADDRPKTAPVGSYLCTIKGMPRIDKSSQKQTPFVEFTLIPKEAGADVDEDDLATWLTKADGTVKRIDENTFKNTIYTTENSVFMLNDFLEHCGIESDGKRSRREMLDDTPNCDVVIYIRHEARQDGQGVQARIGKSAPADSFVAAE